jgi:tight adherence protein C
MSPISDIPIIAVCALFAASAFLFVIAFFSRRQKRLSGNREDTFDNGFEKLYIAIFGDTDPLFVGQKLGLESDKYMLNCQIIGREPNLKKEMGRRLVGTATFVVGALSTFIFTGSIWSFSFILIGAVVYYVMIVSVVNGTEKKAKLRKKRLLADLPRFADLLRAALVVGTPIDGAIDTVSKKLPGVLSEELRFASAEFKLGAKSWQNALEDIARKYEANAFSDFVLDIVTSYSKGISVADAVQRKSVEIKQENLLSAKEKVSKMANAVLIPVMIFKILPLLLILLIPVVIQILEGF